MVTAVARKPMKNKLWSYVEKVVYQGDRSLSSMQNFDFKRYTLIKAKGKKTVASLLKCKTTKLISVGDSL